MVKKTKTTGNCKCENCIAFEKRIEKSKERIRNKLEDKELNNIYFLTLYELPFIFSDGKIIAGFREDNPRTSPDRSDKLIEQPLNTLHLTERVIKRDDKGIRDHFERLANAVKVKVGGGTKKLFEVESNAYEISNHKDGAFSLIDYCGLISGDKAKPGQYSDSAKVNFYLYKFPLKNRCSNYLYIIWSCGEKKITKRCRFKRYSTLEKSMSELFENVDLTIPQSIHPFCKMSDEQPPHSTSKCNTRRSNFKWSFKPQTLSGAVIDQ